MKRAYLLPTLIAMTVLLTLNTFAQNVTVNPGSGSYATLKDAFDAINAGTHTGTITIDIVGNTTETASAVLNASGTGSASYTSITISPSGGAARTISGSLAAALIDLNGADNVTIDGLNTGGNSLTISNESTSSTSGTCTIRLYNDATNNVITRCSILGSATMSLATNGGNIFISTAATGGTGNDDNTISYCLIGPAGSNLPSKGIYGNGTTTSSAIANSNITITNCEIYDFFLTGGSAGVYATTGNTDWTVTFNKIYQTAARTYTTSGTMYGIYFSNSTYGNNIQITNNTIGYSNNSGTGTFTLLGSGVAGAFQGIYMNAMTTAANACNINENIVSDISLTSSSGALYAIYNATGASSNTINIINNSIRNINLLTSTGGLYGISWTSATNMTITGNSVHDFYRTGAGTIYGIYSGSSSVNETVSNNTVYNLTAASSTTTSTIYGIYQLTASGTKVFQNNTIYNLRGYYGNTIYGLAVSYGTTVDISNNTIYSLNASKGTGGTIYGLRLGSSTTSMNMSAYKNKIYDISSGSTGASVYGITIEGASSSTTRNVYNNLVGDLRADSVSGTDAIRGINITATGTSSNINVYYNTVYINASSVGANFGTSGIYHTASTTATTAALDLRNNIIINNSTAAGTGFVVAFRRSSGAVNTLNNYASTSNYNNFYAGTPGAANLIYYDGTSSAQTIAAYKAGVFTAGTIAPRDANSFSENTTFLSTTGSSANFLHVDGSVPTLNESGGLNVGGITVDYDNQIRQGNVGYGGTGIAPDVGADEFEGSNPSFVTLDMGATVLVAPIASGCYSSSETVTVTIKNYGLATIDFSVNPTTVTTNVTGAVTQTLSATVSSGTLAPGASQNVNMSTTLDMTTAGTYTFNAYTTVTGDGNAGNDAMAPANRTVLPNVALPQSVDFTGFDGSNLTTVFPNWREATGTTPVGTTSIWLNQSGWSPANTTAKINLYTTSRNEWIVGPKFTAAANTQLKFKAAVTDWNSTTAADSMGSDDKVRVMLSTDCGSTWSSIYQLDATSGLTTTLTEKIVSLGSYSGQHLIIAFYATDGPVDDANDYDFHLDDILIESPVALDMGALALAAPGGVGCYSSAETVTITIKNYGLNTIDFSVNPVTVTTNVTGAVTQTLSATVNSGTLASNATQNVNMTTTLNMTTGGTYTFNAYTTVTGDGTPGNDAMTPVNRTVLSLPESVDFTGFNGSNLTTVFPNWREAAGASPSGTTSVWLSQTGLGGVGNITARINLYTTTRNEWIIGPSFTPTATTYLKFKAAVTNWNSVVDPDAMGSDDKVRVMISTDGGTSWTSIYQMDATSGLTTTLTQKNVSLSAYSGQCVIIGFYATDGPVDDANDYDFHLDDIQIYNASNMSYVSSTTTQNSSDVGLNQTNQQVIGIQIVTSGVLSPLSVTNFNLNTNGTTNPATDISNAKIFYTGTSSIFSAVNQFGSTVASPNGAFAISGSQALDEGTNYFWLTYDIPSGATDGNSVDAECTQITVGSSYTPDTTAPFGARIIRGPLNGTYNVGLTPFNKATGKNLTVQKLTRKVEKWIYEPNEGEKMVKDGEEILTAEKPFAFEKPTQTELVDEDYYVLVENGQLYDGKLSFKYNEETRTENSGIKSIETEVFATLTSAIYNLNYRGVSGPVTFVLKDASYSASETFPLIIDSVKGGSATNTVTIKPFTGVTATISGAAASSVIFNIKSSNIIIDGSNSGGTTRDLTITNTSTTSPTTINIGSPGTTAVTNITVKNCVVINGANTSSAIVVGDGTTIGNAGYFNNVTLQNNSIQKAYIGIYNKAVLQAGNGSGLQVFANDLSTSGANAIRYIGTYLQDIEGAEISGNTFANFDGVSGENDKGIHFYNTNNTVIGNNKIYSLKYTGTSGYAAYGISNYFPSATVSTNVIKNNMISDLSGDGDDYTGSLLVYNPMGIFLYGTQSGAKVYHNSIYLSGNTLNNANSISCGITLGTGTSADVRNNIIVNNLGLLSSTGYGSVGIFLQSSASQLEQANFNNYFVSPTGTGVKNVGQIATTGYSTLSAWKTATGKEQSSQNISVTFAGTTDLHLSGGSVGDGNLASAYLGVANDLDGDTRNAYWPYMGADEITGSPLALPKLTLKALIQGFYVNGVDDTLTVYLAKPTSPYTSYVPVKGMSSAAGYDFYFPKSNNESSYYVVVTHRNSIETWSANPISTASFPTTYDFTSAQSQAYNNNMKLVSGKWCIYGGEIANNDQYIDGDDVTAAFNAQGASGYVIQDVTGDDYVDGDDVTLAYNNQGVGVTNPIVGLAKGIKKQVETKKEVNQE